MPTDEKRGRGRPPKEDKMLTPVTVRLPAAIRAEIESLIEAREDAPTLGGVLRELVAEALAARRKRRRG